jgi:hypothetical protein
VKIRPCHAAPRLALGTLAIALGLILLMSARAQLRKYTTMKGFKVFEYYESIPGMKAQTNQVKSFLSGSEGQLLTNGLVRITRSRLENYPPRSRATNLVAMSPESYYEHETRLVTSTSALHLQAINGRMILRGQTGYEFSMTNNHLIVSNYVRGFIHDSLFKTQDP